MLDYRYSLQLLFDHNDSFLTVFLFQLLVVCCPYLIVTHKEADMIIE